METDTHRGLHKDIKSIAAASLAVVLGAMNSLNCATLESKIDADDAHQEPGISTQEKALDGSWESAHLEGYRPIEKEPGYFHAAAGKKTLKNGCSVDVRYISLDELARISKDNPVGVHVTEPSWCGPCFDKSVKLGDSAIYLTVDQARCIGWTGKYIPADITVKDGAVVENRE